ncbi:MAG: T9SS type A sorting domain-containing protein [Ignavibacteria bacterium]|nr:T9SS type A sorting domain-containing protein [Ignavibacteria bacterium]
MSAFLFLLITSQKSYSADYWLKIDLPNSDMTLNRVISIDSLKFYIAADSGKIFYSSNGGLNWVQQNTGILNNIGDICFSDANTGYAIAWEYGTINPNFYGTIILKTTNGGLNWNSNYKLDTNQFYTKITFVNNQYGYLVGFPTRIQKTTNNGNSWTQDSIELSPSSGYPVYNVKTIGTQFAIACGGHMDLAGVIWKTTNGGANWKSMGVAAEPLYAIYFLDNQNFMAVGGDFEYGASLVTSSDAGVTWNYTPFNEFGIGRGISFRTLREGWIALEIGQKFMYTMDAGKRWGYYSTPNGESIKDVYFSNNRHGIAVGQHAAILCYNTALVGVENAEAWLPESVALRQNYPNPFNPATIISFTLDRTKNVEIKIFDALGKEIRTLVSKAFTQGEHSIKFDAANLPAGVYFYTLKTRDNHSITKKMVLVK